MKVGFTGTREGMSGQQLKQLELVLDALSAATRPADNRLEFHDGDEPHSDRAAAKIAVSDWGFARVPHPPTAFTAKELLARNREIVAAVDILIAAPRTDQEELRSGTWATVRYARQRGIPIVFLTRGKA